MESVLEVLIKLIAFEALSPFFFPYNLVQFFFLLSIFQFICWREGIVLCVCKFNKNKNNRHIPPSTLCRIE